MNLGNGMLVIGRCERMGLGSMTEDFCRAFHPDHLVVIDRGRQQMFDPREVAKISYRLTNQTIMLPEGVKVVVGFETFYQEQFLRQVSSQHPEVKIVLFPMWEWTHPVEATLSSTLITLSYTDRRWYQDAGHRNVVSMRWPASLACQVSEFNHLGRQLNWPPKTFVHIGGNASHNRDGTMQVIQAASHLRGTGAKLVIYSAFHAEGWDSTNEGGYRTSGIEFRQAAKSRRDLLDGCDCLVQPRRLGGHSLPIDEAVGEGIPVVTLDMPDWADRASFTTRPVSQPAERFGRVAAEVCRADPEELGYLLRRLAIGDFPTPEPKSLPTWDDFKADWAQRVCAAS